MRLAYLVSRFPALSETFVVREILEIQRLGHKVQVYSLKSNPDAGYDEAAEKIVGETEYSPFFLSARLLRANLKTAIRRPLRYWGTLLYVLAHSLGKPVECLKALVAYPKTIYYGTLMASRGVQHIHAHFANVPTLSALIISRIWGIPYSFVGHGMHDVFQFTCMIRQKVAHAEFAITVSEYNRSFFVRFCSPEEMRKVVVVHTGADIEKFSRVSRCREQDLIVTVARLSKEKGLVYLAQACALLRQRGVAFQWLAAGEGRDRNALETALCELNLEACVRLLGAINADEVPALLARAHVFVLPSTIEGLPVTLMEAMAARVSVVATAITGIPELVRDGETGLLVPPRAPVALADAIETLLNDSALAGRLAENAHRLVSEEFDLRKNARRLAELIEQHTST